MYSNGKIMECAEAFRKLVMVYKGNEDEAMLIQLQETADILERLAGKAGNGMQEKELSSIRKILASHGIDMKSIHIYEPIQEQYQMVMNLSKSKRGILTATEVAGFLGRALGKRFRVAQGSRQVVSKETGEFIFEEEPKYRILFGQAGCGKGRSHVSGDNYTHMKLDGGRTILGISDGMGCGNAANEQSMNFIELLEQMLMAGFDSEKAAVIINRVFADNDENGNPVTLDLCTIDEYSGRAQFIKMGSAAGFIKHNDKVEIIKVASMPAGVFEKTEYDKEEYMLMPEDYVIMMSDGVLDALPYYDKEKKMMEIISGIKDRVPQVMAQRILEEALFYNDEIADDMTVLVAGIWNS